MSESTWRTSSCWFVVVAALAPLMGQSHPQPPLRVTVLEHADRWTGGATGLAWLLQQGGFVVKALSAGALARADLVAFGSFNNNGFAFPAFVRDHGVALRDFVARGGVVLELAQRDQFSAQVPFLPAGNNVPRGDADDAVCAPCGAHTR